MAFTPEQEQALLSLLNEKKVTLSELPAATSVGVSDLLLTRQGITDKSITSSVLKSFFAPAASTSTAGVTKLSSELNSDSEAQAATSKAVKSAIAASLQKSANLSDLTDSQKALQNLGIADMLLPIGVPLPWPTAAAPTGWLKCNGAAFNKTSYPKLALAYPNGVLPDLRGEFIRGWDEGRGVDSGRIILSKQDHALSSHSHTITAWDAWDNTVLIPNDKEGDRLLSTDNSSANGMLNSKYSTLSSGGAETRPRNIAFNYIVRAA